MRIAIIGQQAFGESVLQAFIARGDQVAGVFCAPDKSGGRLDPLARASREQGIPLFQLPTLRDRAAADAMRGLDADLAVMAYVLQFAPQAFVTLPRYGTIQYHPSLLPKYRGPSSINWPLIKGEQRTGLTIFRPTDGLDEGPIILQKSVDILPDDTVASLYFDRLFPLGVAAMLEAADIVVSGRQHEIAQDESLATYEGWCRDAEARINWNGHVDIVYNLIRGCNPSPGAWTTLGGRKVRIYDVRKHLVRRFADVIGKPGEVCAVGDQSIHVSGRGGQLEILAVKPEGGQKVCAAAFAAAHGLESGVLLGT
jgi:methionyl-tRNA formyltransferase